MKLKDFDFRIWNGKKYLKQKIYNDNINNNEYIAVTGNIDDENYVFTIEHGCERDYYGGDYDEYCKVKDFTTCNYEIELFTGLFDKNGNKIYEGDVIIFDDIVYDTNRIGVIIKRHIDEFRLEFNKNDTLGLRVLNESDLLVIGNIHENSELIKGIE